MLSWKDIIELNDVSLGEKFCINFVLEIDLKLFLSFTYSKLELLDIVGV